MIDNPECPQCDGPGVFIGGLGNLDWFGCRNCGWEFYLETVRESTDEGESE
jgi:hypothetical protein